MLQNLQGSAGPLQHLAAERPDGILVVEPWHHPLPSVDGYSRCFEAARSGAAAGRGGVAQMWADSMPARVALWRARPADGVLWVTLTGLLPQPLYVCLCYLPPKHSGGCPADLESWWQRLGADVAAAAAWDWILLAGDFNARTRTEPDWPADSEADCAPRHSKDRAQPN